MPTVDIAAIVRKITNMPDGLNIKHPSENDDLDQKYEDSIKKHRNWMSGLDHVFEIISHPFSLVLFFFIISLVFLVFRYWEIGLDDPNKIPTQIHQDAKNAMSYLVAIIVTSVFTKFLERRKNSKK